MLTLSCTSSLYLASLLSSGLRKRPLGCDILGESWKMLPSSRFSPITFFICHHSDPHFSFRVEQEAEGAAWEGKTLWRENSNMMFPESKLNCSHLNVLLRYLDKTFEKKMYQCCSNQIYLLKVTFYALVF